MKLLDWTIYFLQCGSTSVAYFLFRILGVPVLRQGFLLTVPGVTIEVAKECSGIRSSMALFITCVFAARRFCEHRGRNSYLSCYLSHWLY